MAANRLDLSKWFSDEELETCPRCKCRTALKTPQGGMVVCTECGVVGFRAEADAGARAAE